MNNITRMKSVISAALLLSVIASGCTAKNSSVAGNTSASVSSPPSETVQDASSSGSASSAGELSESAVPSTGLDHSSAVSQQGSSVSSGPTKVLMNEDGTGLLNFNMSLSQFYVIANQQGWKHSIEHDLPGQETVLIGSDTFTFFDGKLGMFSVSDDRFSTEKGLQVGDTVEKMKKLYGTTYNYDPSDNQDSYSYLFANKFSLSVSFPQGKNKILYWGMFPPNE